MCEVADSASTTLVSFFFFLLSSLAGAGGKGETYSFYDSRSHARYRAFDLFVAMRTHHQRTAGINRRKERVAIFYTVLELMTQRHGLLDDPF